jgi:predicted porin
LFRAEGTNFRNIAGFDFTSQLAENWSAVTGFRNNLFRFDNLAFAQSLDRVEYLPSVNVRYQVAPKSSVGVFYQYGITDYDGSGSNVGFVRDVNSHFVAATIDHDFAANLTASLRGGIQYNDFADVVGIKSRDGVSPYVDGQVSYGFLPGSSLILGVRHQLTATDVGILGAVCGGLFSDPIRGSSATSARIGVSHSFTPKLVGSINGLYQMGNFIGGGSGIDGKSDSYASADVSLSYRITQNISTRVSYAYDRVDSDLVNDLREFSRNRVFLGVNFTY